MDVILICLLIPGAPPSDEREKLTAWRYMWHRLYWDTFVGQYTEVFFFHYADDVGCMTGSTGSKNNEDSGATALRCGRPLSQYALTYLTVNVNDPL